MIKIPSDMIAGTIHETDNYGQLKVTEYIGYREVYIKFLSTGYETVTEAVQIRNGQIRDIMLRTLYGIACSDAKSDGTNMFKVAHVTWSNMLRRCYDESLRHRHPTYKDCTVCDEWLRFSSFYEWFKVNYKKGLHLDKDIKLKGNKVYSPIACAFVSQRDNTIESRAKHAKFISPCGGVVAVYNIKEFSLKMGLLQSEMSRVSNGKAKSHKGWRKAVD